ncbi:hypothetical protein H8B09_12075 [Paenibacillus sp. PR3]|uniref:Polymerase beta nucleotidyltransferase domain-containing protein n=1 Tax=Paenibacillus terricola TaxID=2763503 RepID=A0ABR8MWV3_9BACL|nr:hypothetical protein [Paenibacillus terricola]MBD3919492.1 hypothetical protein [Paenibacillus terricola]
MNDALQLKYRTAMETFVERVRQDSHILAIFIGGSLSYDEVWEKSDIDVYLVSDDEKRAYAPFHLVENGIVFSVNLLSRTEFRKQQERVVQGSFIHSFLFKSTLVYCKDEAVRDIHERMSKVGDRDREIQLLMIASQTILFLEKAEKWATVKKDPTYSFVYLIRIVDSLAQIEVLLNRDIPTREVIHQALRYNPDFFNWMYNDLIHGPKDEATLMEAVRRADGYLLRHKDELFRLLFQYLKEEQDVRPFSEIMQYMKQKHRMEDALIVHGTEWLAEKGLIDKASSPIKLTPKSRIEVDELAYFMLDERM